MIAFGPIPSRRLGKSLGINNIASQKICSYSCVYCQIGNTRNKSTKRQVFYDPEVLVKDVELHLNKLNDQHRPDYLTFVANGEPTLDINLGKEIRMLKRFGIPVAVITNSSLLGLSEVRDDLLEADWVSVKIDSLNKPAWQKVNQPATGIDFSEMLKGIVLFSSVCKGKLNTETMLIKNYNDTLIHLNETASFISSLNTNKSYISVPTRPPAIKEIKAASENKLIEAWNIFKKAGINTELITGFEGCDAGTTGNVFEDILNITAVHPLREDTLDMVLKQNKADFSVVDSLVEQKLIKGIKFEGNTYYIRSYHF